jgi:hypothetical protein
MHKANLNFRIVCSILIIKNKYDYSYGQSTEKGGQAASGFRNY